jgi:enoyl-[acyl-carrier protein] reductase II
MFEGNRVIAHTRSRYPIFQSPMTWIARAPLVSAVSAAGAMGLLESSARDLTMTTREFNAIRAATNQPFGVNLPVRFLQVDPKEETAIIDWLIAQGIHFATTSAGDPGRYVRRLKDAGVTVYHATANLRGALKAVDAGVDGLIVEGAESAGLRNPDEIHSFALLQAVREKVDVPIVAAGSIVDGRGMAAAFALGAEGVTMGTRFVASLESPVHQNYKTAIVNAPITGTIMTDNPPRARSRGLRTPYAEAVAAGQRELHPPMSTLEMLYINGDVENTSGSAGESAGLIHEVKSVRQIVDDTITGFWRELDRLAALRPVGNKEAQERRPVASHA